MSFQQCLERATLEKIRCSLMKDMPSGPQRDFYLWGISPANVNRDFFYKYSSVLVHRADHIRLQNIQLSYDLEGDLLKKLPLKTGCFYVNWSNVGIIWRANNVKIDPDRLTEYPQPAILTFGFRGSFK